MEQDTATLRAREDLSGKTLVVPLVGTGNVAQLAMDVVILSTGAKLLGRLHHRSVLPMAGYGALSDASALTFPLELFTTNSIVFLQQRAPSLKVDTFIQDLFDWAKAVGISRVIVLAGLDGGFRTHAMPVIITSTEEAPYFEALRSALSTAESKGLESEMLAIYAHEGDNTHEALVLAGALVSNSRVFDSPPKSLRTPESWKGAYGPEPHSSDMYGAFA